jgi:hypothetical protein
MNFKSTYQTITQSQAFKNFKQEHPSAELVAGFFILDFLTDENQKALDYKDGEKIYTFSLNKEDEITLRQDKLIESSEHPQLQKISSEITLDLEEIPSIAENQATQNNIKTKFHKIIAVLQIHNNQQIWNLTCMLDGLTILNILIDANTKQVIKFDKKNIMDFIKKK